MNRQWWPRRGENVFRWLLEVGYGVTNFVSTDFIAWMRVAIVVCVAIEGLTFSIYEWMFKVRCQRVSFMSYKINYTESVIYQCHVWEYWLQSTIKRNDSILSAFVSAIERCFNALIWGRSWTVSKYINSVSWHRVGHVIFKGRVRIVSTIVSWGSITVEENSSNNIIWNHNVFAFFSLYVTANTKASTFIDKVIKGRSGSFFNVQDHIAINSKVGWSLDKSSKLHKAIEHVILQYHIGWC